MLRNVIIMFLSIVRVVLYIKKKGVATRLNHGVASSLSWSKSICNLKTGITRIVTVSFQRLTSWTGMDKPACTYLPQGQSPKFPHDWLKISSSSGYPTMIGLTIGPMLSWAFFSCLYVVHRSALKFLGCNICKECATLLLLSVEQVT